MTIWSKRRGRDRLLAGCAIAAALGGLQLMAAPADSVRLVGVSSQTAGKTDAVMIEATEPVAYAVSRPDPLTILVDLRNVAVANAGNHVTRAGQIAGVSLEQATAIDGKSLARVRVTLASASTYRVRSARNMIRLELEPEATSAAATFAGTAPVPLPAPAVVDGTPEGIGGPSVADEGATAPAATKLERVRATHTKTETTVTLAGNGRLSPSALTESDDLPRRLVLDFPNVSPTGSSHMSVDGGLVKQVKVALNSRDPLLTRVVMEIAPAATYHVERTGPDGRDLAVVFENQKTTGDVMIAPPSASSKSGADTADEKYTLEQALANGAALAPRDPIVALTSAKVVAPPSPAASAGQAQTPAPQTPAQPSPAATAGQAQNPPQNPPPTMTANVPGSAPKQYTGAPINFDFEDADLRAVLRVFSEQSGLNMIIDPAVQGRVNVLLRDVPWDQAMEEILRSNKLGYTVEGNIIRIAPLTVLADEQAQQQKLNEAKALAGELHVQTFPLSYAKADAMSAVLLKAVPISARGQINVDARTNTLIITDLPERLQTAQSLIGTLDRPEPQVEVEARVVQTTRDFASALGIQWGFNGRANAGIGNTTGLAFPNNGSIGGRVGGTQGPTDPRASGTADNAATAVNLPAAAASSAIGLALGSINGAFNLDVALTALESTGKGRVLSTPRLTTQNNQAAEVAQGVQIPIQSVANNTVSVSFRDATLSLKVTPQITMSNTVIMNITVANETPDFSRQVNGIPPIDTQRATTTVQVNDGATTVIGGIFVSQEQTTNDRTPALYRVPLLKWLFQRNTVTDSSRELLIFITPRILRG